MISRCRGFPDYLHKVPLYIYISIFYHLYKSYFKRQKNVAWAPYAQDYQFETKLSDEIDIKLFMLVCLFVWTIWPTAGNRNIISNNGCLCKATITLLDWITRLTLPLLLSSLYCDNDDVSEVRNDVVTFHRGLIFVLKVEDIGINSCNSMNGTGFCLSKLTRVFHVKQN